MHTHFTICAQYTATLQHTATHRNTLQHTATHCNTLQHTATHCNTLQNRGFSDSVPTIPTTNTQNTATHCNTLPKKRSLCVVNTLQKTMQHSTKCIATHCEPHNTILSRRRIVSEMPAIERQPHTHTSTSSLSHTCTPNTRTCSTHTLCLSLPSFFKFTPSRHVRWAVDRQARVPLPLSVSLSHTHIPSLSVYLAHTGTRMRVRV